MKKNLTLVFLALFGLYNFAVAQPTRSMTLAVDASEAPRNILHVAESFSVQSGPVTLFYPKWIPGEHGPTGPVIDVVSLKIKADGKPVAWKRDLVDMFSIHLDAPAGTSRLDVSFDFVLAPDAAGFSSGASSSAQLVVVSWNQVVLYPLDARPDDITVTPSLKLPDGWKYGTALRNEIVSAGVIRFPAVSLTKLVDSPVLAAAHFKKINVSSKNGLAHTLNLASDGDAALNISPELVTAYQHLVTEANALFGATHYDHFDFLYTLSDHVAHFGLEHHESNDDRVAERTLIDDDLKKTSGDLLPHEFVHSWNGKYRRPAGLATGDFSTPMKGDLLWVYEGLTQYLGKVLATRSGLWNEAESLEGLAMIAAYLNNRPGRGWRPLQDTGDEAQLLYYTRADWDALRRSVDYYDEGVLIWLEVDVTIRQLTKGKKSLDDFCRKFHGGQSSSPVVKPYTFEDVVSTLNDVAPNDWATLLTTRLQSVKETAPLGGLEASGWKLVYRDSASSMEKATDGVRKQYDARYSLGFIVKDDGTLIDVTPATPAALAGLAPGMKLVAVNGRKYSMDILKAALIDGKTATSPLALLAENREFYATYSVDYHGGERFPYLERDASKPDVLTKILSPLSEK